MGSVCTPNPSLVVATGKVVSTADLSGGNSDTRREAGVLGVASGGLLSHTEAGKKADRDEGASVSRVAFSVAPVECAGSAKDSFGMAAAGATGGATHATGTTAGGRAARSGTGASGSGAAKAGAGGIGCTANVSAAWLC